MHADLQVEVEQQQSVSALQIPELQEIASSLSLAREELPNTGEQNAAWEWPKDLSARQGSLSETPVTGTDATGGQASEQQYTRAETNVLGLRGESGSDTESGPDRQEASDTHAEVLEAGASGPGAPIVPMGQQELAEHEALISSILAHGTGQQDATGEPSLNLHPVKLEHNITSKEFHMRCAHPILSYMLKYVIAAALVKCPGAGRLTSLCS